MSNFIVNTEVPNIRVIIRNGDDYNVNLVQGRVVVTNSGSFNTYADLAGQVVTASYALFAQTVAGAIESASWSAYAVTASYVSGAASTWDTISGKPDGLVSSSAQATTWAVATASIATTSSFASTASYASNADLFDSRNSTTFASTGSNTFVGNQTITGSIRLTGSISSVDYLDINTTATADGAVGRLQWDDGNGTAILGLKGGVASLQIGQEVLARVYNDDTIPLVDGMVVYITGAQGNRIAVKRASAVREVGSANTLGVVTEPIAVGAEGFITLFGVVNNLNTIGLTPGAVLWLSETPGQYTETRPEAPSHGVVVGYVERVHASAGSIYVKVDNGYELDELHDVNDTSTTSSFGDLIVKSGSVWINSRQLTGSYNLTGSFNVLGTISGSITLPSGVVSSSAQASTWTVATSSIATTASFALTASYVSGAASTWDTISNKPSGLVSSSIQINTGSFSGSFTGALTGTSSWSQTATTASYAVTSSLAINSIVTASVVDTTITFTKGNGSQFSVTIAQSGSVSSASYAQIASSATSASIASTASFAVSASYAPTILPSGVVSSSAQINTGSYSGSFTGTLTGTSSWAQNVLSSSYATTASYFDSFVTFPNGLSVTGSMIATAGFTGSLSGSATTAISSSYALTASYVSGASGASISSSYALTASYSQNSVTASYFSGSISFPAGLQVTGSLNVSGSITGSLLGTASLGLNNIVTASAAASTITFTKGNGTQFSVTVAQSGSVESSSYATSAGTSISASFATTASFARSASFAPTILPSGVVSSSLQINTGSYSGSFTGTFVGTSSWATNVVSASFATTAITASYFTGSIDFTNGLVVTGSVVATTGFTGSLSGSATTAISSSYALTASYALNGGGSGVSSSYATTSSYAVFAQSSATASYISGGVSFPSGLDITGSLNVSGSITGSLLGTASIATTLVKQTISLSSSISQAFTNITSGSQHLSDGVYAISSVLNSPSLVSYRLAGTFSWHTGSVSTSDIDEIFLHRTGQSASSASIFMRTNAISGSTTFLQIGSDFNLATGSYTFTLVKMI